jgi:acyl-coenzyme A synthetase/AMP-(fatty) acid ligase
MAATLRDHCERHARTAGAAVALAAPDRPDWTYAHLARGLERAGEALAALGYGRGSRIAIAMPDDRVAAAMLLAGSTWTAAAPLNARLDASAGAAPARDDAHRRARDRIRGCRLAGRAGGA